MLPSTLLALGPGAAALAALLIFEPSDVPYVYDPLPTPVAPAASTAPPDYFSPLTRQLDRLGSDQYSFHDLRGRYALSLKELEFTPGDNVDIDYRPVGNGWTAEATMPGSELKCSMGVQGAPAHGTPLPPPTCQRLASSAQDQSAQ
jgi:hypothetical protein